MPFQLLNCTLYNAVSLLSLAKTSACCSFAAQHAMLAFQYFLNDTKQQEYSPVSLS